MSLHARAIGMRVAFGLYARKRSMLKISVVDSQNERHLVLEGKLVAPWTTELRKACEQATEGLDRKSVV